MSRDSCRRLAGVGFGRTLTLVHHQHGELAGLRTLRLPAAPDLAELETLLEQERLRNAPVMGMRARQSLLWTGAADWLPAAATVAGILRDHPSALPEGIARASGLPVAEQLALAGEAAMKRLPGRFRRAPLWRLPVAAQRQLLIGARAAGLFRRHGDPLASGCDSISRSIGRRMPRSPLARQQVIVAQTPPARAPLVLSEPQILAINSAIAQLNTPWPALLDGFRARRDSPTSPCCRSNRTTAGDWSRRCRGERNHQRMLGLPGGARIDPAVCRCDGQQAGGQREGSQPAAAFPVRGAARRFERGEVREWTAPGEGRVNRLALLADRCGWPPRSGCGGMVPGGCCWPVLGCLLLGLAIVVIPRLEADLAKKQAILERTAGTRGEQQEEPPAAPVSLRKVTTRLS
jgi:hypothetical protein